MSLSPHETGDGQISRTLVRYLVHHIFLPPLLPQQDDFEPNCHDNLLRVVHESLSEFRKALPTEEQGNISAASSMLLSMKSMHMSSRDVNESELKKALESLDKEGASIVLHIDAQNAGVVITQVDDQVLFETFELSATNKAVMATKGRLRRRFPAHAVNISKKTFNKPGLQATIAETLARMSHQYVAGTASKARKQGDLYDEDRDTRHPRAVTELFMGFIAPMGEVVDITALTKNTRDDVQWRDSRSPWRRSSMWLLVRVALQLTLGRGSLQSQVSDNIYKEFMVFLMSRVLDEGLRSALDSDTLYSMISKLERRLRKLGSAIHEPIRDSIRTVIRNTDKKISERWQAAQNLDATPLDMSQLINLDFEQDTFVSLPALDNYIEEINMRQSERNAADFSPSLELMHFSADRLPQLNGSDKFTGDYAIFNLQRFEAWVSSSLRSWMQRQEWHIEAAKQLSELIARYHSLAQRHYSSKPEGISIMILTILELWVVCDEAAIRNCPLIVEYNPDIPENFLPSLLLPFREQMERLQQVEKYLLNRRSRASHHLFLDWRNRNCFAVRYFDSSPLHQALLAKIERWATEQRESKVSELQQLKKQYADLMEKYCQSVCTFLTYTRQSKNSLGELRETEVTEHHPCCNHCSYKRNAGNLEIFAHEWPLPSHEAAAKAVVFELQLPPAFACWRDITTFLILDVLKSVHSPGQSPNTPYHCHLSDDPHLRKWFIAASSSAQRIGLLSQDKPYVVSHRKSHKIADITENQVCVKNGLSYKYFDCTSFCFVQSFQSTDKLSLVCTYGMPDKSSALQKFIWRPLEAPSGPPPNAVIASQSECPADMSLHEFKELSSLALGYHLQWWNILAHLTSPSIDFKKPETALIIWQCVYQAGPAGAADNILRESHKSVSDENAGTKFLEGLYEALERIKGNWESAQAVAVFSAIAARLLSLSSSVATQQSLIEFLNAAREVCFEWVSLLRNNAQRAIPVEARADLMSKCVEIALICTTSFDVDSHHLESMLGSRRSTSILIQSAIIIRDGQNTLSDTSSPLNSILLLRFQRLLHRSYPTLARNRGGLDSAIGQSWSAYQAGKDWTAFSEAIDYWLVTETASSESSKTLSVQYNLLTGEFLVNGCPLDRPPKKYEKPALYSTLFGHSAVEVMPSAVPGMQFSTKREHEGYVVHLGLRTSPGPCKDELLVQASNGGQVYDVVPEWVFDNEFPLFYVEKFVHWYNLGEKTVQFRSVKEPWNASSTSNWTLSKDKNSSKWQLRKDGLSLVGLKSITTKAVGRMLAPLARSPRIHTTLQRDGSRVQVEIPKLRLSFALECGASSLYSKQFRGMFVDSNQSLGSIIGFSNKLLLRHDGDKRRLVLVPEGPVSCSKQDGNEDHVRVTIDQDSIIGVHRFDVDDLLERLQDTGSLHGKLFLAYIHALTSFCYPDPLTRKTGTEQALSILTSAAVKSFDQLSQNDIETLKQIARIGPFRKYYPVNDRVMQTVTWNQDLWPLSQHGGLHKAVQSIFDQVARSLIFYPDSRLELPKLDHTDQFLLERDCIRSSTFRVSGYGAEDFTSEHDVFYEARDRTHCSEWKSSAYIISSLIYYQLDAPHWHLASKTQLWNAMCNVPTLKGADASLGSINLAYDALWLQDKEFVLTNWLPLHKYFKSFQTVAMSEFDFMIWMSSLASAEESDRSILQVLALVFTVSQIRQIDLPVANSFRPSEGCKATRAKLNDLVRSHLIKFSRNSPEASLPRRQNESNTAFDSRRQDAFLANRGVAVNAFVDALYSQWPCESPVHPNLDNSLRSYNYIDTNEVMAHARTKFRTWVDNSRLNDYLEELSSSMSLFCLQTVKVAEGSLYLRPKILSKTGFISIETLFAQPAPCLTGVLEKPFIGRADPSDNPQQPLSPRLDGLVRKLAGSSRSKFERTYVDHLQDSLDHLRSRGMGQSSSAYKAPEYTLLLNFHQLCKQRADQIYSILESAVSSIASASCMPRVSRTLFLEQLSRSRWQNLSCDWKNGIVEYGLAVNAFQQADRLVKAFASPNKEDLLNELENVGHTNWDPMEYPEWLLLEIESGIIIRKNQKQIAAHMKSPPSNLNTVMQMNMGEGKSSVIVPMVAVMLADGSQLVRVVVAKPQSKQMAQMLVSKLGGLLNRRIYYMPFSRALKLSQNAAHVISTMSRECMMHGGVMLLQPEHMLSFGLMAPESYISGDPAVGKSLADIQNFFDISSRDIVDESDENFSVKFELIYTMGAQRPIEMSPHRWVVIQQVLDLIREIAPNVLQRLPLSLEVKDGPRGSFPRIRIIRSDAGDVLFHRIAKRICKRGLDGFPIARQPKSVRNDVYEYITNFELTQEQVDRVENGGPSGFWTDSTKPTILLLRGLLAGGVLAFMLEQKRWRVNYGLAPTRIPTTKLVVPYRAKDSPTPRSEFSHPDVVIGLTSLCYYYSGLNDEDLFTVFSHLTQSDQSDSEYQIWMNDAPEMPRKFAHLQGINLKDRLQCTSEIFPHLRTSKGVVDYFLSHVVFPKEMKEFPQKLSASGWDIGKIKECPTTGFSGTNDSRMLLPLDVKYLHLPFQQYTNALVLYHLLNPDNSVALMQPQRDGLSSTDAETLLAMVIGLERPTQVILDVGAQILELDNLGVARKWLEIHPDPRMQAVVYFDDDDRLSVIDREGHQEALQSSPYADQLDACLVFLDEAHTRGTDLKLPHDYRAAVTLGRNLSKDRLVQACMRMRKLGKGQTVVFCISPEIKTKIEECTSKQPDETIDISDVLQWAISETYTELRRSMPLWATQGERFVRQQKIRSENLKDEGTSMSKRKADAFLEEEAQPLEKRYRPNLEDSIPTWVHRRTYSDGYLDRIAERCQEFDNLQFRSSVLSEEQERELAPEIEEERQVERARAAEPAVHNLHPDVVRFVSDGVIFLESKAYIPAFQGLADTSAAAVFDRSKLIGDRRLLATADFLRTVKKNVVSHSSDAFQRSVQWILTSKAPSGNQISYLMIISPYEAQELMLRIRASTKVSLHLYKPRINLGYRSLDRLDFLTIPARPDTLHLPRQLAAQLNLFAGQLYLNSFEDYREVCTFSGLAAEKTRAGWTVAADGFVLRDDKGRVGAGSGLTSSPVQFLGLLMTIRRNGEGTAKTHIGRMLQGKVLCRSDFEDAGNLDGESALAEARDEDSDDEVSDAGV